MGIIDSELKQLTTEFYNDYSHCSEILNKVNRPYCVILLTVDSITYAIPFRTNIKHKHCYLFRNSPRSDNSGLDFSKAIIVTNSKYIGKNATIDSKEYSDFINNKKVIGNRFANFIKSYKTWYSNPTYYKAERLMQMSSLQYFHKEMGLE
jgi:protein AbiQ